MNKLNSPDAAANYARMVADHRGWKVNPDATLIDPILAGLAAQSARYGKPFCPCRDVDGGKSDQDIVCPCVYAAADISDSGQCFCGLFLSPEKDPKTVSSIPERRPERS